MPDLTVEEIQAVERSIENHLQDPMENAKPGLRDSETFLYRSYDDQYDLKMGKVKGCKSIAKLILEYSTEEEDPVADIVIDIPQEEGEQRLGEKVPLLTIKNTG